MTNTGTRRGGQRTRLLLSVLGLFVAGLALLPVLADSLFGARRAAAEYLTAAVEKKPFRITILERGEIDSRRNATLLNKVEGVTTIIWIIPEGTDVKEGDLLCELDSSALVEKEKQQQIAVTQAEADLRKAEENLEIQKTQNESDLAAARLAVELAQLDLEKYEKGEAVQTENELRSQITLAEEKLIQAKENYEFTKRLAQKGYKTLNEVETQRIAVRDAELQLAIAKGKLEVHLNYTYPRTIKELREKAAESVRELKRIERAGIAALAQLQADLTAKRLTFEVQQQKLKDLQEQIAACKIYAPQAGKVVYANQRSRRSDPVLIEEGAQVRERQPIIKLPDFTQMQVNARIHESKISDVRKGQKVLVYVDALPDQVFHGVMEEISSVPVPGNWPNVDLKEYEATVRITDPVEVVQQLKPGLTASMEIIVDEGSEDVLQVPIQAVIPLSTRRFVYVLTDGGPERREILVGRSNESAVEVKDGLAVGEHVILNPRTHFADELAALEAKIIQEEADRQSREERQAAPAYPGSGPAESRPHARPDGADSPRAPGRTKGQRRPNLARPGGTAPPDRQRRAGEPSRPAAG